MVLTTANEAAVDGGEDEGRDDGLGLTSTKKTRVGGWGS